MASELQIKIGKKLKELGGDQPAVVALGYSWPTVTRVAKKMKDGWDPDNSNAVEDKDGGDGSKNKEIIKLEQASYIRIEPKTFRMTSRVFWDAYEAVTNNWPGWKSMKPEEFLDKYLEISLLQRGILLGGYVVLNQEIKEEEKEESNAVLSNP